MLLVNSFSKLLLIFVLKNARYEYFKSNDYKYDSAEYSRLSGKLNEGDNHSGDDSAEKIVFYKVETCRQRVYGRCYSLQNKRSEGQGGSAAASAVAILVFYSLVEHFSAYKTEQSKCYPRNKHFKRLEIGQYGGYKHPAEKWHERLKKCKQARDTAHFAHLHTGFVKTVGKRHGKGVYRQSHAQKDIFRKEQKVEHFHTPNTIKNRYASHTEVKQK